ncbi:hypothetical protein AB0D68_10810 [Streptomyces sp. NPDC048212]|uniref:hypothetical protein n=1 Tax=Streptomyces sp. NPDC048212 TaxID=3156658 RepID=UPI0033FD2DD2
MKEWEGMTERARKYWELYSGKREVLGEALFYHDPGDQFAWVQGWRFAIADYITFNLGENVEGFRPAAGGPDTDSYEYESLCESAPDLEALRYAEKVFERFREWLRIAGEDY